MGTDHLVFLSVAGLRPTDINKTTTPGSGGTSPDGGPGGPEGEPKKQFTDEEAIACSLENPEACEACD